MNEFERILGELNAYPKRWLVTGVAGFIGSNLLEFLLELDQEVIGLDNFSTGYERNLAEVEAKVSSDRWKRFRFIRGDIRSSSDCTEAVKGVDYVLHQAALGSVPRSLQDPITTNDVNVNGFLNMLVASRDEGVESFTYAASSSTYGDHPDLPKVEDRIGKPLSPYAVTKHVNEQYADVFAMSYEFKSIGLRYFNVFGKRQDPDGAYAAVIPKWTSAMIEGKEVLIYGDGETSRDFCYVDNAIQANILAAKASEDAKNSVYNVAVGDRTTLNDLFEVIRSALLENGINVNVDKIHQDFRAGDVRHSQADISKAARVLNYTADIDVKSGISLAMPWYIGFIKNHS